MAPTMLSVRPSSSQGRGTPDSAVFEASQRAKVNRNLRRDQSGTSLSSNTTKSSVQSHAQSSNGWLNFWVSKHALFHVCVQVHQVDNIPLVQGEFALRWKVNNAGKTRPARPAPLTPASSSYSVPKGQPDHRSLEEFNSKLAEKLSKRGAGVPSVVVSSSSPTDSDSRTPHHRPSPLALPSQSSGASSSSSSVSMSPKPGNTSLPSPLCSHIDPTPTPPRGMTPFLPLKDHSVVWSQTLHTTVKMSITRPTSTSQTDATSPNDIGLLQPSPMKLVVLQRIIPGDPGAPRNPRLGAVYLDLAEYAGVNGETTRKYLLRDSKINATLKLTISVTHVGGDTDYRAPPLPKAEIMNGVSGLLESDVYKTRPRALDICGPYYSYNQNRKELAVNTMNGLVRQNSTSYAQSFGLSDSDGSSDDDENESDGRHGRSLSLDGHQPSRTSSYRSSNRSQNDLSAPKFSARYKSKSPQPVRPSLSPIVGSPQTPFRHAIPSPLHSFPNSTIPFDIANLPYAFGPKNTESLIDALFNPVTVVEKPGTVGVKTQIGRIALEDNPFVYFIPKEAKTPEADITIGRSFAKSAGARSPPPFPHEVGTVRPKSTYRAFSAPNASISTTDSAEVSSVYSAATSPSSASVSTSNSGHSGSAPGSSKGSSSNKSTNAKSHKSSNSSSSHRPSETPSNSTSPSKGGAGWLRRRHNTTAIVAQSNPHSGTKPDLYNHVDSVVGIVLS